MSKDDPNKWPDIKKVQWHLDNGDGFMIRRANEPDNMVGFDVIQFQGRDYLGYPWYKFTKEIGKLPAVKKWIDTLEEKEEVGG